MSLEQDTEWGQICWNCYLLESMIYSMAWDSFKSCASQLVQNFKAKNPNVTKLSDTEYVDMYADLYEQLEPHFKKMGMNVEKITERIKRKYGKQENVIK